MQNIKNRYITLENKEVLGFFERGAICLYFFLTYFEPYFNGIIGPALKYYIFFLVFVLIYNCKKAKLQEYHCYFYLWFFYKFLSVIWTNDYTVFSNHILSHFGMWLLFFALTIREIDKKTITCIYKTIWLASGVIGVLATFFSQSYHGTVEGRQVLLFMGQEIDPNNQAAFLLVGIAISLYYLLNKVNRKIKTLSVFVLLFNLYGMFLTASRGGLVSIVVVITLLLLFGRKNSLKYKIITVCTIIILGLIFYYIAVNYLPRTVINRLFDFDSYEDGGGRVVLWKAALDFISEDINFIFGAGWGAVDTNNVFSQRYHNTFLSMWSDVGIIGLSLFFLPVIMCTIKMAKEKNILVVTLLFAGLVPSFFVDAINKRFFWSPIIFLFMEWNNVRKLKNNEVD